MKIYIISDTHFYHTNIIKYCGRPFRSCSEMNEKMISKWNGTVTSKDLVIHLGDFTVYGKSDKVAEICSRLKGKKILVRGNHDRKSLHWYLTHGFDFVCDEFVIGYILFTHRPVKIREFLLMPFKLNVHGHLHEKDSPHKELYENVCVEKTNYYPVNLDCILGKHELKLKRKNQQGD